MMGRYRQRGKERVAAFRQMVRGETRHLFRPPVRRCFFMDGKRRIFSKFSAIFRVRSVLLAESPDPGCALPAVLRRERIFRGGRRGTGAPFSGAFPPVRPCEPQIHAFLPTVFEGSHDIEDRVPSCPMRFGAGYASLPADEERLFRKRSASGLSGRELRS